jgi:acetolactate synthase-1/2/3 large subunit
MTRPTPETLAHRETLAYRAQAAVTSAAAESGRAAAPTPAPPPSAPVPQPAKTPTTGAGALVKSLEALGVEVVFGIPGGAVLPAYDPLFDSTVRHILVRHEQGAGHAATGYAQATGRVGVCIATSGPGATNLVTPIADAYMDSVAMVAITGQVPRASIGTDAFQEADIQGITLPITKHNYLVQTAEEIPRILAEAFHLASTGRPGPVLVDIPKDVLQAQTTFSWPPTLDLPGYRPTLHPHGKQIREAARLMTTARRPVLYVGGGVLKAGATAALRRLAELTGIPVVTTLMARGAFPDSHPQHLGMPGMHGTVAAVYGLQKSDLIVALGARFDDRVTGRLDSFAPAARIVHADIDPAEIGKNRVADVPIVGDARHVIDELIAAVEATAQPEGARRDRLAEWWSQLDDLHKRYPLGWEEHADGTLAPQYVIQRLGELCRHAAGPGVVFVAGVGQHQMWASQFISYDEPGTWLNSGGLGTMGYAVPAALGAKVGRPDTMVWAIDGDGCFQMTNQELATCAVEGIPIKVAVINNGNLGMVRQWQTLFYGERYSSTELGTHKPGPSLPDEIGSRSDAGHPAGPSVPGSAAGRPAGGPPAPGRTGPIPDFVKLAEALGCVGLRCETAADVDATIEAAMAIDDAPVVIDFVVGKDAMVWPMVAAGTSNDEIMFARDVRPTFDEDGL